VCDQELAEAALASWNAQGWGAHAAAAAAAIARSHCLDSTDSAGCTGAALVAMGGAGRPQCSPDAEGSAHSGSTWRAASQVQLSPVIESSRPGATQRASLEATATTGSRQQPAAQPPLASSPPAVHSPRTAAPPTQAPRPHPAIPARLIVPTATTPSSAASSPIPTPNGSATAAGLTGQTPVAPTEDDTVLVTHLGAFQFKGSGEPINIVCVGLGTLAGRVYPEDPPKGKGCRVSARAGLVGAVRVTVPNVAGQMRARLPAAALAMQVGFAGLVVLADVCMGGSFASACVVRGPAGCLQ